MRARRLFDCFIFYNELDLLELRLRETYGSVDHFVICEATRTFRGKPKPLLFHEHRSRFEPFLDKIIPIAVEDLPVQGSAWDREHFQRNCLRRGLTDLRAADVAIISDCDEIPSREALAQLRQREGYFVLDMPMYQFYMNMCALAAGWRKVFAYSGALHGRIGDYNRPRENPAQSLARFAGEDHVIGHAGWHFTFLGGAERIRDKLQAYSHTEAWQTRMLEGNNAEIQLEVLKDVGGGRHLEYCAIDSSFPEQLRTNLDHYIRIGYVKTELARIRELERLYASSEDTVRDVRGALRYQDVLLKCIRQLHLTQTTDLALNRPATQSSVSPWSAGKSVEEDARRCTNGRIYNGYGCHTAKEIDPWWEVDLGAAFVLSAVCIYNHVGELAARLRHFTVLGGLDREMWCVLVRKSDDQVFGREPLAPLMIVPESERAVRFVRIRLDGENFLHFDECLIFGRSGPVSGGE
jgi:beta-1,4-mannosyl-glycoprotein beta-1,4-N-acetylglucosaminyltransferase